MRWIFLFALSLAIGGNAQSVRGQEAGRPEAWADSALPVTKGLYRWLDASTLSKSQDAKSLTNTSSGEAVGTWFDGSGNQRDVHQPEESLRPTYQAHEAFHSLRFDGVDDFLDGLEEDSVTDELTIFLVAVPFENSGGFSAFLSMASPKGSDFMQGINVDLGPGLTNSFQVLNIEGSGKAGASNFLTESFDFGTVTRLCIVSRPGERGLFVEANNQPQAHHQREADSRIHLGQTIVGARYYTAFGPPPVKGFLRGEIAEILIYDRALEADERKQVDQYLRRKYSNIPPLEIPRAQIEGIPLVRVPEPRDVQVFVPGFTAKRLPVELTNLNNVLYRPDGKLVALGYDGRIHLLSDQDGDGLEETAELFWANDGPEPLRSPIGMALTLPGDPRGQGVYVAGKGKCSLILDTDGDDRADTELIVADGWKELFHGVDALGIEVDPRDGSVYIGLGTTNFTNAYLVEDGKANYSLTSERGTILKVAPDFQSREIIATGIRFPVGIRLNAQGDLFCSDQEGATWLTNGNPFDELLHIEKGRHYGFPPRHPQHLPGVIDEPSTYDYRPQHQCTCGLNFNDPIKEGAVFGPAHWESDVFVAGYSRGKVYRTKLIKTDAGYVAQNQIFACIHGMPADQCFSPDGAMVIISHSGGPDWGSGPTGEGTIYKVFYSQPELPQPSLIWPQSANEIRVAFDRPVDPAVITGLKQGAQLEYGRYVAAGDRFEHIRPGYQVVQNQMRTPRYELPIHSVQVTPDQRTLIIATSPHPENAGYALTLPGLGRTENSEPASGELVQDAETDLQYDLSGLEAEWEAADGSQQWKGWLPHWNSQVADELTLESADHQQFRELLKTEGELRFRSQLVLKDMLRPAVQPGSEIDYEWPAEVVTVTFQAKVPFVVKATMSATSAETEAVEFGVQQADLADGKFKTQVSFTDPDRVRIELLFPKAAADLALTVTWNTNEDPRLRPFPLNRILVPWAKEKRTQESVIDVASMPELQGGDWVRGRELFFGELASCSKCHLLRGEGGVIGPDLSNLPHRDYESVLRDITQPSFAINPDYLTQTIALTNGQTLVGTVRTQGDILLVGDSEGNVREIHQDDIELMVPSRLSVMPDQLAEKIGPEKMKDLMVFLLSGPPRMPDYGLQKPPAPREMKEVQAVLNGSEQLPAELRPLNIVLVSGPKDHGPGEHDYPAWKVMWQRLMSLAPQTTIETADVWPSSEQLAQADVMVFYQQGTWTPERAKDIDAYLARGGGLVYIHYAVDGGADAPGFAQRIGLAWKGGASAFRHGELELGFDPGKDHPIARNFDKLHLHDESYWQLLGDPNRIDLIAQGVENGEQRPLFWTLQPSNGKVFVSIPGHFSWTFDDPLFRILLLRGIAWSAGESVDRFNDLAIPGARIVE